MLLVREDLQYLKAEKANINEELRQVRDDIRVLKNDKKVCGIREMTSWS